MYDIGINEYHTEQKEYSAFKKHNSKGWVTLVKLISSSKYTR